ncbi:hypothetical protein A9Q99_10145 [Gammaproteobacteria bacterium 45_16_T64]|nr:hypothetical protein A9Q99_10145 [Gammaproteobacteria bacterium 45_16_T64]
MSVLLCNICVLKSLPRFFLRSHNWSDFFAMFVVANVVIIKSTINPMDKNTLLIVVIKKEIKLKQRKNNRHIVKALALTVISALSSISIPTYAGSNEVAAEHRLQVAKNYHQLKAKTIGGKKVSVIVKASPQDFSGHAKVGLAVVKSSLQLQGVKVNRSFEKWGLMELEVDSKTLDLLIDSGEFEMVKENAGYKFQLLESTQRINAVATHTNGHIGYGTSVAVIDSGVETSHPFFGGRIAGEACFSTHNPAQGDYSTCPNGGEAEVGTGAGSACFGVYGSVCDHGTHVAGIVAGFAGDAGERGVAPGANIVPINIVTRQLCPDEVNEICYNVYESDLIEAFNWVLDNAAAMDIAAVNLSLSSGSYASVCDDHILAAPINDLRDAGIAVVVASGNGAKSDAIGVPACISSAISVGSTEDSSDAISGFSNSARMLDLLAPGSLITSSIRNGQYAANGGTSMAAPHVAGAFAVMRAASGPEAGIDYLQQVVEAYGDQLLDFRNELIKPRLDLLASVNAVLNSSCSTAPIEPSPPTVTATTDSSVLVSWNTVPTADLYTIQMWDFDVSDWRDEASTEFDAKPITGLSTGPQYFRVRAVNSCGESDYNLFGIATL